VRGGAALHARLDAGKRPAAAQVHGHRGADGPRPAAHLHQRQHQGAPGLQLRALRPLWRAGRQRAAPARAPGRHVRSHPVPGGRLPQAPARPCACQCARPRSALRAAGLRRHRQGPGVQTHFWGPEGEGAAEGLRPGDVLASNHPQLAGGSHLPDITVITPVFNEGRIECAPAAAPPRIRDQPACRRAGAAPQVLCGVARPPRGRGRHHARVHAPQQPPAGRGGRRHHRVQACARGALPGGPLPPVPRARFWPACASCTRQRHCHAWRGPHGRQAKAAWRL